MRPVKIGSMDDRLRTLFDKVQSLQCLLDEIPSTQTGKPPRRSKEECRWWARIEEELPQLRDYIATNGPQIEATDPSTSKGLVQAWCKVGELVQQLLEQHADGQPC